MNSDIINIAVYGGSFDCIHLGHTAVVSHLLMNESNIDLVYIVPCFKQKGKKLTDFEHRYNMCVDVFENISRCVMVSDVEKRYNIEDDSLIMLQKLQEDTSHFANQMNFVIGSDLLDKVDSWGNWEEIKQIAPPLVVGRAGCASVVSNNPVPICPKISSTEIRDLLKTRNPKVAKYIPTKAYNYIISHDLYLE